MAQTASRVLVVEDHPALGRFIAAVLIADGWHVIGPIDNHASAIDAARRRHFVIAVIDWMLRGEEAAAIVDAIIARRISCLLISGHPSSVLPVRFREVQFLQKPFTKESLLGLVSAAARGSA